jgi:hypothetical protein
MNALVAALSRAVASPVSPLPDKFVETALAADAVDGEGM